MNTETQPLASVRGELQPFIASNKIGLGTSTTFTLDIVFSIVKCWYLGTNWLDCGFNIDV